MHFISVQGHFYREPHSGKLAVVLGAGEVGVVARSVASNVASNGCSACHRSSGAPAPQAHSQQHALVDLTCLLLLLAHAHCPAAGNQHFLALSDVLHLTFVDGCVCMLKYHPLMAVSFGSSGWSGWEQVCCLLYIWQARAGAAGCKCAAC